VVEGFADGPAHSLWLDSESSDVSVLLGAGYGRLRLEVLTCSMFDENSRRRLADAGMVRIDRPPRLAAVTDPMTGEMIQPIIVHDETWILTDSTLALNRAMQTMAWAVRALMQPDVNEDILVQVVQRDRSCERCWEVAAHENPH